MERWNSHSVLTLALSTTSVDGSARQSTVVKVVVNVVNLLLAVDEDKSANRYYAHEEVVEGVALLVLLSVDNLLSAELARKRTFCGAIRYLHSERR